MIADSLNHIECYKMSKNVKKISLKWNYFVQNKATFTILWCIQSL